MRPFQSIRSGVVASVEAERLAAMAVASHIADLITLRPLPIGTGDLLARHQHGRSMLGTIDVALALHGVVNHVVQVPP